MNASSLHLWLGFHSFLNCQYSYNHSLKHMPKAWTYNSPVIRKASWFIQCSLDLEWDPKDLKLSLCCNSGPVELGIFAYWCFSSGAIFTCQPGLYLSTSTVFPDPLLCLTTETRLWILLQDPAHGHCGTRGNAFHTLIFPLPYIQDWRAQWTQGMGWKMSAEADNSVLPSGDRNPSLPLGTLKGMWWLSLKNRLSRMDLLPSGAFTVWQFLLV